MRILINKENINKHLSAINLSITMGLLFMVVHLLNPEVSLIKSGPALFLAGANLTILYFYYRNIWLPIGLHFGNNYFHSIFHSGFENHPIFGSDGYLSALILCIIFLTYMGKMKKQAQPTGNKATKSLFH